ncbi:MAG TPA: radical SAM protein [Armatimonadota bacterium]|nr:radical SAM protein [Armatimonadota bacterium]
MEERRINPLRITYYGLRVLLINPPGGYYASRWEEGALPSLGLGYLAAYLEQHGVDCRILDAHALQMRMSDVQAYIREYRPDITGITFTTENRFIGFDTIRAAKAELPDTMTVAGGPHVSPTARDTLSNIPELDVVVRGEGEQTLLELAQSSDPALIPGISYRRDGRVVENPPGDFIHDLDSLPFPARHLMPMERYQFAADVPGVGKLKALNIMASRGCPFNCSFCASPGMWGRRYRARSPENVLAEVDELVSRYGAKALWVFDDTFTIGRARTTAICQGLAERLPGLKWFCEIRVDTVDRELLALMRKAGCYCVAFGVESGSQRVIDESVGKRIKLEQVEQVVNWCNELGLEFNPFMILSHPGETEDDARETMRLIRRWKDSGGHVSMAIMHIYPGTRIESIAREKGILPAGFSWTSLDDAKRVPMLPAAQGHVPIFLDKLSWDFLAGCLFEWARMQRYSVLRRIPKALASIRSFGDVKRYWGMLKVYLRPKQRVEVK